MSTRFFASVRRNQKQWMVVVTVLSMVSFLFLDDFAGRGNGPMSPVGGGILIGCLCAAGMCIIGYPRQQTSEFGIAGFAVGFLAGLIGFGAVGSNKPVVRTASGSYSRSDLEHEANKRQKANQFAFAVYRKIQSNGPTQGFGGADDQSLITYQMLLADARKLGIRVSDEAVNDFLKRLTQGKLTQQEFKDCLREARLGEGELFDLLKDELAAQLSTELMSPPAFDAVAPPGLAQYVREPLRYMQETPQQLWESYQMLNLKESLEAVEIPVKDLVAQVGDPSESELLDFFDKFKGIRWTDEAQPGFLQLPKVQLAYLTAEFEKFEPGIVVSDDDIRQYYDQNKDKYRAPPAKDSTAPNMTDEEAEIPKEGDKPKDGEAKPTDKKDAPAAATEEKKDSPEKKDAVPEKKDDSDKSTCGVDEATEKAVKNAGEEKKPADDAPKAASEKPAEPKPDAAKAKDDAPKLSDSPEALPPAKFRELTDSLKLEIQETILKERAKDKMAVALDRAFDTMIALGLDYDTATTVEQKKEKVVTITEKLKQYAKEHNLEYKETEEVTYEDLTREAIGGAFEGQGRSPVVNEVFMRVEGDAPRMPLYYPHRADLRTRDAGYAYWKIAETPAHMTNLKDEAVHDKVIAAWKFDQARGLAEKRAKALAEKAKADSNNLLNAISGESATGEKNGPQLSIIETPEFTWLSTAKSVPSANQDPMITDIPLISHAGNDFMKVVFEDLKEGEVGVAVNENRSSYFVVKVKDREATKDDGGVAKIERQKKFMSERFTGLFPIMKSPYEALAQFPQRQIDQLWRQGFEKRHQVDWENEPEQPRRVAQSSRGRRRR